MPPWGQLMWARLGSRLWVGCSHDAPLHLSSSLDHWVPYAEGQSTRGRCMEVDDLLWNAGLSS